jgi:hypothetical protein
LFLEDARKITKIEVFLFFGTRFLLLYFFKDTSSLILRLRLRSDFALLFTPDSYQ